jgi:hypothetical protein
MSMTHGHTRGKRMSPTYCAWQNMLKRCTNPSASGFKHYGYVNLYVGGVPIIRGLS